ncbi:MAG: hypothetical protein JXQ72_05930 [Anaerolineae bacterium]|nr:hypothetical protein [Anaerolineae bacterium]
MSEGKYLQNMHSALDHDLSEEEQAALHAHLEKSSEAAQESDRLHQTDELLRSTPQAAPSPGFADRVMAALAALPLPDFMNRQLSVGLALGLATAAILMVPLLSVALILLLSVITDPGALNAVLQTLIDAMSYLIGIGADFVRELRSFVSGNPLVLVLLSAVIPVTVFWGWLVRHLWGRSGPVMNRQR